jgi:hypothetical protein
MSTLSLAKNGYVSSSKRTKHIKAKYFFVHHYHNTGEIDLQYCPTEQMWADVLTKPLQGAKFRLMRAFLMNCPINYSEDLVITPTSNPTTSSPSLPSFVPTDEPTDNLMKKRSLRHRGGVLRQSLTGRAYKGVYKGVYEYAQKPHGPCIQGRSRAYEYAQKNVKWKNESFTTSSPSPSTAK